MRMIETALFYIAGLFAAAVGAFVRSRLVVFDSAAATAINIAAHEPLFRLVSVADLISAGCYVAVTNRVGLERPAGGDGIEFWGQSFVAGTSGQILARASADKEENLIVPVDLEQVDVTRTHWPFLRDRRIDAYDGLTKRLID